MTDLPAQRPILVLDGETRSALAVVRSLGKRPGLKLVVASHLNRSLAQSSKYCSKSLLCPDPRLRPRDFTLWLENTIPCVQPSFLLPLTNTSLELSYAAVEQIHDTSFSFPFVSRETFNFVNDKAKLCDYASKLGIKIPSSLVLENQRDWRTVPELKSFPFPGCLKPVLSETRVGQHFEKPPVLYPNSLDELFDMHESALKSRFGDTRFLLQERIVGVGIGVFALFKDGEAIASFCHRRILEKPPSGGVSVLSESIPEQNPTSSLALSLLRSLKWNGVAMVEFKRNSAGEDYLMEINPRFWGSLQLAISCGRDFPSLMIDNFAVDENSASERRVSAQISNAYEAQVRLRWPLGSLDHFLILAKQNLFSTLRDVVTTNSLQFCKARRTVFDVWSLSDPAPAWRELVAYCRALL